MDASSSQEKIVEPPRHLFFGVEDRRLGGRAGLADKYLSMEKGRRHQLAEHVINSAIQLANAVRTLRTFDRTGNADQALDHLTASLDDLVKHTRNLSAEVEQSVDRYGDGMDELDSATRPKQQPPSTTTPAAVEPTPPGPDGCRPQALRYRAGPGQPAPRARQGRTVKARIKRFAVVWPVGRPPFKDRAELHYRDNKELADQLADVLPVEMADAAADRHRRPRRPRPDQRRPLRQLLHPRTPDHAMRAPSVRVGRNRRRTFLYLPLLILGALAFLAALATFPIINSGYLAGVTFLITGAAGFVFETGQDQ